MKWIFPFPPILAVTLPQKLFLVILRKDICSTSAAKTYITNLIYSLPFALRLRTDYKSDINDSIKQHTALIKNATEVGLKTGKCKQIVKNWLRQNSQCGQRMSKETTVWSLTCHNEQRVTKTEDTELQWTLQYTRNTVSYRHNLLSWSTMLVLVLVLVLC